MNPEQKTAIRPRENRNAILAKLPSGQYTVAATYDGRTLTRRVGVAGKGLSTVHLRWPSNPETDFVVAQDR